MSSVDGMMRTHTISLYVANKAGVLNRLVLVFSRRGWNIDSLSVSPDPDGKLSRCTIVAQGDTRTLKLIIGQLKKLVDVIDAREYPTECVVESELALIRLSCPEHKRGELAVMMSTLMGRLGSWISFVREPLFWSGLLRHVFPQPGLASRALNFS